MNSHSVQVYQQSMQQLDKDELHVCPYDPSHRISAKRFVRHIIKCRKNHAGADKSTCPFNARHVVPKPELQLHISSCPDRRLIENEINCERLMIDGDEARGDTSVPPYSQNGHMDFDADEEDWDREVASFETQKPNYRTVKPSSRYVWDDRDSEERTDEDSNSTNHYATQSSQPFPMERRPMGHPQLRSGIVGMGRGRIRNQVTQEQQKKSKENGARPGPSGASLAANFNVQPKVVGLTAPPPGQAARPSLSRRPMHLPAYRERVDDEIDEEIERSLATEAAQK